MRINYYYCVMGHGLQRVRQLHVYCVVEQDSESNRLVAIFMIISGSVLLSAFRGV